MPDVFLSYTRDDQAVARRFAEGFARAGFSVWWDQALSPGDDYDAVTEQALLQARAVVVLWSRKSAASRWVRAEATMAQRNKTLMPVCIEACNRPIMFELVQTADLSQWQGDDSDPSWMTYLAALRHVAAKDGTAVAAASPTTAVHEAPVVFTKPEQAAAPRPTRPFALLPVSIVAGLALLVIGVGWWWNANRAAGAAPAPVTLAVLPFANLSSDREQEYFSDGLTEEILNQLAQVRQLRVSARTSSFSFKGRNEDIRAIGKALGVDNILEGSVRNDGQSLRITAQLINVEDGAHRWSRTYDREPNSIFDVQEEVAKDVATALSVTLDVGAMPRMEGGTASIAAYEKYLKARDLFHQNDPVTSRDAARLLREAVTLDPKFSRAWLLLSSALSEATTGLPQSEVGPLSAEARAAGEQVLQLTPDAWWAQPVRISQFVGRRELARAESVVASFVQAGAFSDEMARASSAFLRGVGRVKESVRIQEQLRLIDPLSLYVSSDLQTWLDASGRSADAQTEYERSRALSGGHGQSNVFALVRLLARKDADPAVLRSQFHRTREESPINQSILTTLVDAFDRPEQARAAIRQALDDPTNQDRVRLTVIALLADGLGERELALDALQKQKGTQTDWMWLGYKTDLRTDARFKALVRERGLAEYFRASGKWGDFCSPMGADDFECR
jgi:TolB-like protein